MYVCIQIYTPTTDVMQWWPGKLGGSLWFLSLAAVLWASVPRCRFRHCVRYTQTQHSLECWMVRGLLLGQEYICPHTPRVLTELCRRRSLWRLPASEATQRCYGVLKPASQVAAPPPRSIPSRPTRRYSMRSKRQRDGERECFEGEKRPQRISARCQSSGARSRSSCRSHCPPRFSASGTLPVALPSPSGQPNFVF